MCVGDLNLLLSFIYVWNCGIGVFYGGFGHSVFRCGRIRKTGSTCLFDSSDEYRWGIMWVVTAEALHQLALIDIRVCDFQLRRIRLPAQTLFVMGCSLNNTCVCCDGVSFGVGVC